jgi:hypothetical protein
VDGISESLQYIHGIFKISVFKITMLTVYLKNFLVEPPSKPRNLVAEEITHNSITLSWIPPVSDGGRKDVQYRVACTPCESVSFHPGWENINQTR